MLSFVLSLKVLDQEIAPASEPLLSFPGVSLLRQLALSSQPMSATMGKLPLVHYIPSYYYSSVTVHMFGGLQEGLMLSK
ncbi:hypothetical protein DSO57_1014054 [Entomophthora muscae]|uniref:Uncharacterized protein n=1 Tax=Entomophthora muscae TaxID=34485 RepID=A0ACC2SUQ2_9FUNG|nr:hypothetical protein DSO57_1014054 [Entomophthora muscae]